ncbi:hypothetical protein BOTCAL_0177g00070 [Botryotinia calthae]|uniref:Uncharacterized protein n=1 Tax=Botryotinia calthae TaxID=38488 RepID=A0A4Y8D3E2_9HELO|nr:hypothetical protein BOTCAL_0177g00070 [Botryotinia calthae]
MANSTEGSKARHDLSETPVHSAGPLKEDGGSIHTDKKTSSGTISRSWPSGRDPYYPNSSSVFHCCLCHEYVIQDWNGQAVEISPDVNYEIAVQKHVYNDWFPGIEFIKDGKVYIIGADIQPSGERYSCATTKFLHTVRDDGCTYIVVQPLTPLENRLGNDIVDQLSLEVREIRRRSGSHPGEIFWNLPRSHRCHILKFPQEILDVIFEYLLWIPSATVEPDVIITNVVRSYKKYEMPTYKAALWNETHPIYRDDPTYEPWRESAMTKEKKICHGGRDFIQLNRILRRAIDATCLRTCTEFFKFGSEILYRETSSNFLKRVSGLLAQKHVGSKENFTTLIQIMQGVPTKELAGWAYHDQFLRFLYVIRPRNANLIRNLYFWGTASLHSCNSKLRDGRYANCPVDLFPEICIYIQFINELCPNVESVTLEIDAPAFSDAYDSDFSISKERDYEHAITPFLRNQIRELKYVKSLALRSWNTGGLKYAYDNPDRIHGCHDLDFPIAKETIKWFKDRARGWAKDEH